MSAASGLEHLKPFLPGLESALEDSEVSEIMINGPFNVWVERAGRLTAHDAPDLDESALLRAAIHIARPLGLGPGELADCRCAPGRRLAGCHLCSAREPHGGDHHAALWQAGVLGG